MKNVLRKLGFSEYKARAYIALVGMKRGSVGEIAKKSNIPSSKIYETLKWLYENGYISIISQNPLVYRANDPKHVLKSEVEARIEALKDIKKEIGRIKTNLEVAERGNFQIVYGRNSFFKKVKEAVSQSRKSIIAVVKHWRIDHELIELIREFIARGGKMRFLGPVNTKNRNKVRIWTDIGTEVKNFNPESTRFTVWDGRIITVGFKDSGKDYFSLWIENEYLGKVLTSHFNSIWRRIK